MLIETKPKTLRIMNDSTARLIYSSSKSDFRDVAENVRRSASAAKFQLEVIDTDRMTPSEETRFLTDIRAILPQTRGQIRSGKGRILPISGSGKLNRSIPILIMYDHLTPVDVYPKDILGVRYDLRAAFERPSTSDVLGVEHSLVTILSSKPQLLEPGLGLVDKEFETNTGKIDLLFKDNKGVFLAVEAKEDATQETVGQVLKQFNGLKDKLGLSSVRSAIVALRTSGSVHAACQAANIELYLIAADRQV